MKMMKKLLTVILTFAMTLSLAMTLAPAKPARAADPTGSITITNAVPGQTYTLYKIFDLESYDEAEDAYIYKVNDDWKDFVDQDERVTVDADKGIANISGTGGYVAVDADGHVTWAKKTNNGSGSQVDDGMGEFAKLALAYAKTQVPDGNNGVKDQIAWVQSQKAGDAPSGQTSTSLTFSGLALGYYLVDSSMGTLCALTTNAPDVNVTEKNKQPTVEKKVQEGNTYGDSNDAQIGDTVNYRTVIHAQAGAQNYVLHDKMDEGLTFIEMDEQQNSAVSVKKVKNNESDETDVDSSNYTVKTTGLESSTPCTFHVEFTQSFCDGLEDGDQIIVYYKAILNEKASIGVGANDDGNTNETWLGYGESSETTHDKTETYTYQFQIIKTNESQSGTYDVLEGAEFEIYDAETEGNKIPLVEVKDLTDSKVEYYRVATTEESEKTGFVSAKIVAGRPVIKGLDKKTYWLQETKAPDGFNLPPERFKVDIQGDMLAKDEAFGSNTADNTVTYTNTVDNLGGGVQVINNKGNRLPTTGGIGTTIFYVLGGILVIGAGIALFVLGRRRKEADGK